MIDYDKWKRALALTESQDNPRAWGDERTISGNPLAVGRWQMHPAFVDEWWKDSVDVEELTTWDDLLEQCLKAFFDALADKANGPTQLAMWFHLHGNMGAGWDAVYAQRFNGFYK